MKRNRKEIEKKLNEIEKKWEQKCFSSLASCLRLSVSFKFTIQSDPNLSQTWFNLKIIRRLQQIFSQLVFCILIPILRPKKVDNWNLVFWFVKV